MASLIKRTKCIVGVFEDDDIFLDGLKKIKAKNLNVLDTFTPFPVHGMESVLGVPRSNLAIAAFIFGTVGFLCGLSLQVGTAGLDWPINFGGKPSISAPSFVPVTFELTVLLASLGMVATFFMRSSLLPGFEPKIYDIDATSHKFLVLISEDGIGDEIKQLLADAGATDAREDEYLEQTSPLPLPINMK